MFLPLSFRNSSVKLSSSTITSLCEAMTKDKDLEGKDIVFLIDEISYDEINDNFFCDLKIPESVRLIFIFNPRFYYGQPLNLPPSFLRVPLRTPYRSTKSIARLARFMATRLGSSLYDAEIGSDLEGKKPILFDTGAFDNSSTANVVKLKYALEAADRDLGSDTITLYNFSLPLLYERVLLEREGRGEEGCHNCHTAAEFHGWEADKVVSQRLLKNMENK